MPDFCTCGAQLPEDAVFCHKCGRPLKEVARAEAPVVQPPPLLPALNSVGPSFRHPVAVRIGLLVSGLATLLTLILPIGFVIWLPAAGFIAVFLFSRRTGQSLSVRNGARMGWIAGILSFVIMTVLITISAVEIARRPGGLPEYFRQQGGAAAMSTQDLEKTIEMLSDPAGQAVLYLFSLLFVFMVIAVFCTAGGALGAKVLAKD